MVVCRFSYHPIISAITVGDKPNRYFHNFDLKKTTKFCLQHIFRWIFMNLKSPFNLERCIWYILVLNFMDEFIKSNFQLGNTSVINVVASVLDHNSTLVCEAFNPLLPNQRVQDQMPINIHCRYCNYRQGFVSERLV